LFEFQKYINSYACTSTYENLETASEEKSSNVKSWFSRAGSHQEIQKEPSPPIPTVPTPPKMSSGAKIKRKIFGSKESLSKVEPSKDDNNSSEGMDARDSTTSNSEYVKEKSKQKLFGGSRESLQKDIGVDDTQQSTKGFFGKNKYGNLGGKLKK
jgi:hypothetical protein